jgi:hypothetical protein
MERDKWQCVACGESKLELSVHHIIYSGDPWEALDDHLQTLCEKCHKDLGPHPFGGVGWESVFDSDGNRIGRFFCYANCPKCGKSDYRDKGTYEKCANCGNSMTPGGDK